MLAVSFPRAQDRAIEKAPAKEAAGPDNANPTSSKEAAPDGPAIETRSADERNTEPEDEHRGDSWRTVLGRLGDTLDERRAGTLLAYGIVRAVTDTAIVIVKRDEQRMWTATAARDDADATIAQAMALQRL